MRMTREIGAMMMAAWLATAILAAAQGDVEKLTPLRDRPWERAEAPTTSPIHFEVTTKSPLAQRLFDHGITLWNLRALREADRAFMTAAAADDTCAMAWWGMSLANGGDPSRAKELAWRAFRRRDGATPLERFIIEAWADLWSARTEPEWILVDAESGRRRARAEHPESSAWEDMHRKLAGKPEAGRLLDRWPRQSTEIPTDIAAPRLGRVATILMDRGAHDEAIDVLRKALVLDDRLMRRHGLLPFELDAHDDTIERLYRAHRARGQWAHAAELARHLVSLPRHPRIGHDTYALGQRLLAETLLESPVGVGVAPKIRDARWTPREAPALELPRGRGGTYELGQNLGRATLLVFYLGFGCVHCVEQLHELRPRFDAFKAAGIDIVTVGSDSVDEAKASIQMGIEEDRPPMPFPILCDPKGDAFKRYHAWDEFKNEALHGTFLIDAKGRILWRDVSVEPFMETDFLLRECKRLLASTR